MYSDLELREIFHFCFLEQLLKISDPRIYTLKGGVNLRFYYKSPRYSEDMDIDVSATSINTLKKNGYKIINDESLKRKLRTYGIQDLIVNDTSKAKQTETTQRFRLRLIDKSGDEFPTKIEFSRHNRQKTNYSCLTERIDTEIARRYNRLAYLARHYDASTALIQKIEALADRKEVQARDAFDIFILSIGGHTHYAPNSICKGVLDSALSALNLIEYKDYEGKVLEFLDQKAKEDFSGKARWKEIKKTVEEVINQ
jgi:hypothetical protein